MYHDSFGLGEAVDRAVPDGAFTGEVSPAMLAKKAPARPTMPEVVEILDKAA